MVSFYCFKVLKKCKRPTISVPERAIIPYSNYPIKFIESVIRTFRQKDNNIDKEEYTVPPNFFEVPKSVILFEIPFCIKNETLLKQFIKKFHQFTNNTSHVRINWLTRKMRTLFQLKDKPLHPPCKICEGICSCATSHFVITVTLCNT